MKDWKVIDEHRANFKVNHSYSYKEGKTYVILSTLTDSTNNFLQIALFKDCKLIGSKTVPFDDEGAKNDAIEFIFMLDKFDWSRTDIKSAKMNVKS